MKLLDYPPIWLAGFIVVAWGLTRAVPALAFHFDGHGILSLILLAAGIILMGLAVLEMTRARTTIIPRHDPNALVTTGIFRFTRNPIYLGDLLVLAAAILWFGSILALPLLWLFVKLIEKRFIQGEEAKMRSFFGDRFDSWAQETRRWI